jgi:outer membrane protein assembly factor BamB
MLLIAVAFTVALAGCDWPMFGFDAAHTGFSPDTSISASAVAAAGPDPTWTAVTSRFVYAAPVVAGGVLYVGADDQKLYAFDATGSTNCSGNPKTCAPLWTAAAGGSVNLSPAVANGVVYIGARDGKLYAFDAAGTTNCGGTPKTCSPLWTGATGAAVTTSVTVANGVVYVGNDGGTVAAFDAAGATNCSGSPKTCTPLWTAMTGDTVRHTAVSNGRVYVGADKLYVFDAAGTTNCSGSPKTCTPLWTAATAGGVSGVAVAAGKVYVGAGDLSPGFGVLYAFDAAGHTNCTTLLDPPECGPLWEAGLGSVPSSPAVANGTVYIGELGGPLFAFDAAGVTGCTTGAGSVLCAPLWIAPTGPLNQASSPSVANGVVYIGGGASRAIGNLLAFAADGTTNCSGAPKVCTPIFTSGGNFAPIASSAAVANGYVYIGGTNGVAAFKFA